MAEVRPLKGIRYNPELVDISKAICPAYDVINPDREQELLTSIPYNYVRIEFPQAQAGDNEKSNKYIRAAATIETWLSQGVLKTEQQVAFYLHEHTFTHADQSYCRRGIFSRVRLEPWNRMVVRPHENTMAGPKIDRVNLLRALEVDTSPVFGLYQDEDKSVSRVLDFARSNTPELEFQDGKNEIQKLWIIKDATILKVIEASFRSKPLYIADGHHRYESALKYCQERRACSPELGDEASLNFVLMALVDFDDAGLFILPTHRLVRGIDPGVKTAALKALVTYFDVTTVSMDYQAESDISILVYGLKEGCLVKLEPENEQGIAKLMPPGHTPIYQKLDVSLVDHVILSSILKINPMDEVNVGFSHDREDVIHRVDNGEFELAVIVNTVKPGTIKEISDAADKMPRKSTYFYPKLPSGLVAYRVKD